MPFVICVYSFHPLLLHYYYYYYFFLAMYVSCCLIIYPEHWPKRFQVKRKTFFAFRPLYLLFLEQLVNQSPTFASRSLVCYNFSLYVLVSTYIREWGQVKGDVREEIFRSRTSTTTSTIRHWPFRSPNYCLYHVVFFSPFALAFSSGRSTSLRLAHSATVCAHWALSRRKRASYIFILDIIHALVPNCIVWYWIMNSLHCPTSAILCSVFFFTDVLHMVYCHHII
jgi:hypothetical protein